MNGIFGLLILTGFVGEYVLVVFSYST